MRDMILPPCEKPVTLNGITDGNKAGLSMLPAIASLRLRNGQVEFSDATLPRLALPGDTAQAPSLCVAGRGLASCGGYLQQLLTQEMKLSVLEPVRSAIVWP